MLQQQLTDIIQLIRQSYNYIPSDKNYIVFHISQLSNLLGIDRKSHK